MSTARRTQQPQQQPQAAQQKPADVLERELAAARHDAARWRRRYSRMRTGLRRLLEEDAAETATNTHQTDEVAS